MPKWRDCHHFWVSGLRPSVSPSPASGGRPLPPPPTLPPHSTAPRYSCKRCPPPVFAHLAANAPHPPRVCPVPPAAAAPNLPAPFEAPPSPAPASQSTAVLPPLALRRPLPHPATAVGGEQVPEVGASRKVMLDARNARKVPEGRGQVDEECSRRECGGGFQKGGRRALCISFASTTGSCTPTPPRGYSPPATVPAAAPPRQCWPHPPFARVGRQP